MNMNLTAKQYEIVKLVWKYRKLHGIAPTLAELADKLKVSKITVHEHITLLEKKKAITKEKYQSRSLRLTRKMEKELEDVERENRRHMAEPIPTTSLPLLGHIAAGTPIEAVEDREEVDLRDLIRMERASFLLKVKGDSMIDEGIHDGDYVVVEACSRADNGDIVVAIVEDNPDYETTLKTYYYRNGKHQLRPANPNLKTQTYDSIEIRGRVVGVIRKY